MTWKHAQAYVVWLQLMIDSSMPSYNSVSCVYSYISRFTLRGVPQVSPMALVQELKQLLMDYEETCHRTCFSLQLDGNTLDNFTHMKSISGMRDGCVLKPIDGESPLRTIDCCGNDAAWLELKSNN